MSPIVQIKDCECKLVIKITSEVEDRLRFHLQLNMLYNLSSSLSVFERRSHKYSANAVIWDQD